MEPAIYSRCKKLSNLTLPLIRTRPTKLSTIWLPTLPFIPRTSPSPLETWDTLLQQPTLLQVQHLKSLLRLQHFYYRLLSLLRWQQLPQRQPSLLHLGLHARPGQTAEVNTKHPTHPQQTHHVPIVTPMDTMVTQVRRVTKCAMALSPKTTPTMHVWRPITPQSLADQLCACDS